MMRALSDIAELKLSVVNLQALARQSFVASQRRGRRMTYKLRYRVGGVQQVRCLGSDPVRAAEILAALEAWQAPRRTQQALRTIVAAGRALRRSIRPRLAEHVARAGYKFHGRRLRRPRSADSLPPGSRDHSCETNCQRNDHRP